MARRRVGLGLFSGFRFQVDMNGQAVGLGGGFATCSFVIVSFVWTLPRNSASKEAPEVTLSHNVEGSDSFPLRLLCLHPKP